MEIYDIVKKLIGDIEPIGAEHCDKKSFESLKATTELVNALLHDIDDVACEYTDAYQDSIKKACKFANEFLDEIGIGTEEGT